MVNIINKGQNNMLAEKLNQVFESGHSISFQNTIKRMGGEWENRIIWKHHQLPGNAVMAECCWEGFETIEECIDDCLKYLTSIE
jgi:hypothetical protein